MQEYKKGHERMENLLEGMETPFANDTSGSWKAIQNRINSKETPVLPIQINKVKRPYLLAASIAALVSIFALVLVQQGQNRYVTAKEEQHVQWPDGSNVQLHKNTSVTYDFGDNNRSVRMYGSAVFKVEKGLPFSVNTKNGSVSVLGTTFMVNCRDELFNVMCAEGEVRVTSGKNEVVLSQGEAARLTNDLLSKYQVSTDIIKDREKGVIRFNAAPLMEVFQQLENEFDVIVKEGHNLNYKLYSGNFKNDNLHIALDLIALPMDLSYEVKGNVVEFKE